MILTIDKELASDPLQLFKPLFDKDSLQILEWSVKLTSRGIETRCKPTFYAYHHKDDRSVYSKINDLLVEQDCPQEVLRMQEKISAFSLYNGLRIPLLKHESKCLYIHEKECSTIKSYRWKNKEKYELLKYTYQSNWQPEQVQMLIHSELHKYYTSFTKSTLFKRCKGIWLQQMENEIHEVYLAFPERPRLKLILAGIKNVTSGHNYRFLNSLRGLRCKNIGFDGLHTKSPAITIYFTIPLKDRFPNSYEELLQMTHDFFRK